MRPIAGSPDERWWLHAYTSGRWWAGAFGIWTLFGVLMAGHAQLRFSEDRAFVDWLSTMLPFYWAWVPLMPPVVLVASRFDFRAGRQRRSLAGHLAAGGAATVGHGVVYALLLTGPTSGWWAAFTTTASVTLRRHAVGDLATYAAVAGAILALEQYRRAQAREREAARNALRASRLEAQLSAARLVALQMQLHPHFLFNALNSISVMVLKGAATEAIRAVRQLADLLRVSLHSASTQELSLQEEVAFVQGYLEIEQLRFGDRLQVEFAVAPETDTALVPRLILQPLVENAIIHGLRSRVRDGRIRVAARRDNGALLLEVWDNGAGLPAPAKGGPRGVGLTNSRARLKELYGDTACLRIVSGTGGGTLASIRLPFHSEVPPATSATTP